MPFKTEAQRRFLWAKHPEIAKKWTEEEKKSSLVVERGLKHNTVKVDGQDYKVNEGYFKPAMTGFSVGAGANILASIISKDRLRFGKAITTGLLGAGSGMAITEAKRRQIQKILNKDPETAKSLARKGFKISPRLMGNSSPKLEWMADVIRDSNDSLGQELLKVSSMNEFKMIRDLDNTEDDANLATFSLESAGALGILTDTSRPNIKDIEHNADTPVLFTSPKDKYKAGTRHFSSNQIFSKFPNTWKNVSPELKKKIEEHGAIVLSTSDLNKASVLREAARSVNRSKLKAALSDIPNNKPAKILNKVTTVYSFMGNGDDRVADAAAGAQFVMHAPRTYEDIIATLKASKMDKKSLLKNTAFTFSRALPALLPIVGRTVRKMQESNS